MTNKLISPFELEVLIHCFASAEPPEERMRDTITKFINDGIVVSGENGQYTTTEKGEEWMRLILSTPYPVQTWVDPRTFMRFRNID